MPSRVLVCVVVLLASTSPCVAQGAKPDVKVKLEGHRGGVTALALADNVEGVVQLWALPAKK